MAGPWRRRVSDVVLAVRGISPWRAAAIALGALWALWATVYTVTVHRGIGTSAYDFGLYDQGLWLVSRGREPFVTLMGRNLFGDHTSFILLPLVPLYWLGAGTSVLFVVQSLALAIGAWPTWLAARRMGAGESLALVGVAAYLLHPALSWTALENFHPDAFLAPLIATALWAALANRWGWFALATVATLATKEDAALVVVGIGVWVALRIDRRRGIVTALVAAWVMVLLMWAVMPAINGVPFRNEWRLPFGGWGGLASTALTRPHELIAHLVAGERPLYVLQVLLPVGFIALLRPAIAAIAAAPVGVNLLSTFWYQSQIEYHYSVQLVPLVALGAVWSITRIDLRRRRQLAIVVAMCATTCAWLWSPLPGMRIDTPRYSTDSPPVIAAYEAVRQVPSGAVVSAWHGLTAHLARRERVYLFPVPFERLLYGMDPFARGDRLEFVDDVSHVVLPAAPDDELAAVWERERDNFEVVFGNEWWVVYRRR